MTEIATSRLLAQLTERGCPITIVDTEELAMATGIEDSHIAQAAKIIESHFNLYGMDFGNFPLSLVELVRTAVEFQTVFVFYNPSLLAIDAARYQVNDSVRTSSGSKSMLIAPGAADTMKNFAFQLAATTRYNNPRARRGLYSENFVPFVRPVIEPDVVPDVPIGPDIPIVPPIPSTLMGWFIVSPNADPPGDQLDWEAGIAIVDGEVIVPNFVENSYFGFATVEALASITLKTFRQEILDRFLFTGDIDIRGIEHRIYYSQIQYYPNLSGNIIEIS